MVIPRKLDVNLPEHLSKATTSKSYQTIRKTPRERRLILSASQQYMDQFNAKLLRDQINDQFIVQGIQKQAVVASTTKSKSHLSIVVTTLPGYSAQYLIDHLNVWKDLLPLKK